MKEKNSSASNSPVGALNLGLSELLEIDPISPAPDVDSLQAQLHTIEGQLNNRSLPKALVAEQLLSLKERICDLGQHTPQFQQYSTLKERLVTDSDQFSLSEEIKARLNAKVEKSRFTSTIVSDNRGELPGHDTMKICSDLADFSDLVRSFDERSKASPAEKGGALNARFGRLPLSLPTIIALIITCLLTICFAWYRYVTVPENRPEFLPVAQSETELRNIPESPLALPSFEPITSVGALSSLAYDLQGDSDTSKKEKTVQKASSREVEHQRPQPLAIGAQDEPAHVRELQEKPEQKVIENGIDFPPFRDSKPAPQLKAPTSIGGGHAVERFENPRSYVATVATDVMPRPSYYGSSIGALRSGEKIAVDATIGPWVRFRLSDGRQGFVLAQDVSPG